MSSFGSERDGRVRLGPKSAIAIGAAAVVVVVGGATLAGSQAAPPAPSRVPAVGQTSAVCPAPPESVAKPAAAAKTESATKLSAVASYVAPGRAGLLRATELAEIPAAAPTTSGLPTPVAAPGRTLFTIARQGVGKQVQLGPKNGKKAKANAGAANPVVLTGDGVMAIASSGMVTNRASRGEQAGLMAAACTRPATAQWFVGVGAGQNYRTELVLTNPDASEAEVDLKFYGRDGELTVPGSPGLIVPGHGSRNVALDTLVAADGPLAVSVQANSGRIAAVAVDRRSNAGQPTGADWQSPAALPSRELVIPGLPGGAGNRSLQVVNPGDQAAQVTVAVLGANGRYSPVGAESVAVAPRSSAELNLTQGLAGTAAGLKVTSDNPVTAAVLSESASSNALPDIAIQSAGQPIVGTGVVPLVYVPKVDSELVLSNAGETPVQLSFAVFNYDGVKVGGDDVLLVPDGTATRRLTAKQPAYLVVTTPADSAVLGGVVYQGAPAGIAELATVQVGSPDPTARAPQVQFDPAVGS